MIGPVTKREVGCSPFEFKEQVLFAEVAAVRVVKFNGFHL